MAKNKKDQPEGNSGQPDDSSDNFGLPDLEYKPLDRDAPSSEPEASEPAAEPEAVHEEETHDVDDQAPIGELEEEEPRSNSPIIISLIIGLVIVVAGFLIYRYVYVPKVEKEKKERLAKEALEKAKAEAAKAAEEAEAAARKRAEEAANAKPKDGTIESLTERTRRYYVVVSSNIDDDLIMDYAKKLSTKGVSSKIIPPFNNMKYYRLAIADYDNFAAAQSSADASKAEYGSGLWVIRY
jgi:hypothetical protein